MRALITLLALSFFASPLLAQPQGTFGNCNAALRAEGVCTATSVAWFAFSVPDSQTVADLQAWGKGDFNFNDEIPCASDRVYVRGILTHAGVTEADCTAPQIGDPVANPQSANDFTYFSIRNLLRDKWREWEQEQLNAAVATAPEPQFGDGEEN